MQTIEGRDDHPATAQTYGALLTRLNESLVRARDALAAHTPFIPGGSLDEIDALLAEFARRRVRIALYGEVKAGKSTLLNAIAGAPLSPVAFEPLTSIPVRVTHGPATAWRLGDRRLASVTELEQLMRDGAAAAATNGHAHSVEVVVETPLDLLQLGGQVDLLDTPGVGSDAKFDAVTAEALRALDAVVLVVRYPALFTHFTRQLMDTLEADIGKLFVIWNLDAACAELGADERARHAETLRTKIAGAHELFLLDGRAGLRAALAGDAEGLARSGVTAFTDALRRFAGSGSRELAALRETAKRTQSWLSEVTSSLTQRHAALAQALAAARQRLQAAQAKADDQAQGARTRFGEFQTTITRLCKETVTAGEALAASARRELRVARRHWASTGHLQNLETAVRTIVIRYADAVEARTSTATEALRAAATDFGTTADIVARPRTEPVAQELTPRERQERAVTGRWQRVRRSLWQAWYLPGLAQLEGEALGRDLQTQAQWLDTAAQRIVGAGRETLDRRLGEISRNADAEAQKIKEETHFAAAESEFAQLSQHMPVIDAERASVAQLAEEARAFLLEEER
jgi:hypothetical protein